VVTSIKDFKNKKKYKSLVEDLNNILKVINLSRKSLNFYRKYLPVQDIIITLDDSKVLIQSYKDRYEGELEKLEKKNT
jgi:hypothetical protein